MRHTIILATAAIVAAILALWGATAIVANPQEGAKPAPAGASVDVMQMMRNAKNLPEQQFDAH
jgi:hypothetical protein